MTNFKPSYVGVPKGGLRIFLKGYRLPSVNAVLSATHWRRIPMKQEAQDALLFWSRHCVSDSSMRTTCSGSGSSTPSGTLEYFKMIAQNLSALRSGRGRSGASRKKARKSK